MDIDSPPSPFNPDDTQNSPHKHLELPGFSSSFPLPFRVLFLIGLAQLLWAINLHALSSLGLDVSWILDLRDDPDPDEPLEDQEVVEAGEGPGSRPIELSTTPSKLTIPKHRGTISLDDDELEPDTPVRPNQSTRIIRPPSNKLHGPVYKLFLLYSAWCGSGWLIFRLLSNGIEEEMERWRIIPGLLWVGIIAAVLIPWRGIGERERAGLRRAIKRIFLPSLDSPIFFCDVILADILTSFAKVLGDMWISACQIWLGEITHGRVGRAGWAGWVTLGMVSLPYLLRFRQCLLEYYQSSWTSPRPLANALKYFSAFPVIFLSAAQKTVVVEIASQKGVSVQELGEMHDRWFGEHRLFRLWLLAVCVNSMFSFYWDVEMDWGLALCEVDTWLGPRGGRKEVALGLLGSPGLGGSSRRRISGGGEGLFGKLKKLWSKPHTINHQRSPCPTPGPTFASSSSSSSSSPEILNRSPILGNSGNKSRSLFAFGLRPILLLPDPIVYHLFTVIDLVLRFTWSLKLSSHLHTISEIESGVFMMEALELIRRWMWVFIRIEWENVKMSEMARFGNAPNTGRSNGISNAPGSSTLWENKDEDP
ncbi:uncharacterized protein I303_102065 [Kwoniella dejecticola CBS 10117]|uniref:EXS domain-containing protein n=1 Tax=Kwoniella dejecticola CBS 10117 TaxID=1296121 RepID=A0A1A6ABZ8_9TREE|nr:uncharacterized protein I303_01795 [Kwoniella dejecticola CBS 10117]OBR87587.1 hypothetical protein I303_01795 [Kwoniella dejecticola CBS 10117]